MEQYKAGDFGVAQSSHTGAMQTKAKMGVVGLWHLGCVLCASWSKMGFSVTAFDYSPKLIGNLTQDKPPVFEPNLAESLAQSRAQGRLIFTSSIASLRESDFVFLAYDTPVLDNDTSDLTVLYRAVNDLAVTLKDHAVVIVSSQTPVGTCNKFRNALRKFNPTLELVYSPENLRLGQAIDCYLNPGRIIIGADDQTAASKAASLFGEIKAELITMNLVSAEMVKHAINAFLANSVVFANHLSELCEVCGANVPDVIRGVKTDERIGPKAYLSPGIGFSGGTLGRDLRVLAGLNVASRRKALLYESILEFNSDRKTVIVDKIIHLAGTEFSHNVIAVLGLTYKPQTSTLRRSLPLEIVQTLIQKGAKIKVYDPKADYAELDSKPQFDICSSIDEAITDADLVVLLTEWDQFKRYSWDKGAALMRQKRIFDPKNFLYELRLPKMGYEYVGVGLTS